MGEKKIHWHNTRISMVTDTSGSLPDSWIYRGHAWLHLTRHLFALSDTVEHERQPSPSAVSAIDITATTGVMDLDYGADLSRVRFGIIQLAKLKREQLAYGGRRPQDGSIVLELATPPHWPSEFAQKFMLDANGDPANMPFADDIRDDPPTKVPGPGDYAAIVTCRFHDHPSEWMPLKIPNPRTNRENFVMRWISDIEFLTAFVMQYTDTKEIEILMHLTWRAVWKINYRWTGDVCDYIRLSGSDLEVGETKKGYPDPTLAQMITNPNRDVSKTYNAVGNKVFTDAREALSRGGTSLASNSWPADVHSYFMIPLPN